MKKSISIILLTVLVSFAFVQDKPAYKLYNQKGEEAKYAEMVKDLADADMVFFGEYHTDPIAHWMQIELTKSLHEIKGEKLFFGAEMFENGNQLVLNEYLAGLYPEAKMLAEITQLWGNYKTDYKPMVEFAKENNLRFIATNIPRRYASLINKKGFEGLDELSAEAKSYIGPDLVKLYDPEVACYKNMMKMSMMPGMTNDNFPKSQAAKDATMAHFSIINHNEGDLLLHFEGSYHSNYNQGIIWWVNKIKPGYNIKSIATVYQSEWDEMTDEEKATIANYTIVVADGMTQTKR